MLILISVTDADLSIGKINDCLRCPVALAIDRRLKPGYYASVHPITVRIVSEKHLLMQRIYLEADVIDKLFWIDSGEWKEPFQFEVDIQVNLLK